jgi:hypothetical protein
MPEPLPTLTRDDRTAVKATCDGMSDLLMFADAFLTIEKYGLSVVFDQEAIEWEATDPSGAYRGVANSPGGAVFCWDHVRETAERNERAP